MKNLDFSEQCIAEISQNSEKSPGDQRDLLSLQLTIKKWGEKQFYGHLERQTDEIFHVKHCTWLRNGNLWRETASLLTTAENNIQRNNYIKARSDKTQQNSKCRLHSNRDESINYIKSKFSKLAQIEYETRHDWVGKVIL